MLYLDKQEWRTYIAKISRLKTYRVVQTYYAVKQQTHLLSDNERWFCEAVEEFLIKEN